ncbi:hypothetical protein [Paenibacillus humicola]|uniref:hypothetical protein n=1 Tax=Paenibacillus humicola TaxID=3110540 RepID=UPI00237BC19E|nr:hypothetical protein [Paenibacillus humicola]
MEDKECFCCICCGYILDREVAAIVFRTGFYKIVYPLGCCKRCAASEELAASAETPELPDNRQEGKMPRLPVAPDSDLFDDPLTKPSEAPYPLIAAL